MIMIIRRAVEKLSNGFSVLAVVASASTEQSILPFARCVQPQARLWAGIGASVRPADILSHPLNTLSVHFIRLCISFRIFSASFNVAVADAGVL